jgi:cellulose synthase (UDP-forming)
VFLTPKPPTTKERDLYLRRNQWFIVCASSISFSCAMWSATHFLVGNSALWLLAPYFAFTIAYFLISLSVNLHQGGFDIKRHRRLVEKWRRVVQYANIDIFLPTAGEEIEILMNTWNGVSALMKTHPGLVCVYVLDDSARQDVRVLAQMRGFFYSSRDNRGWYQKAGNLRHGFHYSQPLAHEFIVIFDADFRPRLDFLSELLPYFYEDPTVGLVQSPQYFDVGHNQSWLERGAGSVQEFFYRFSQVARQSHDAAICVGTNAIYRRDALNEVGGTALIGHSEDVHTGFNLRMAGWKLQYVPLILAKGTCPDNLSGFFRQQYRWCMGSMSLLGSKKFWITTMPMRSRFCYFTGFCYYLHTAITLLVFPLVPLYLLLFAPGEVVAINYLWLAPALTYSFMLFPLWHKSDYGAETWAVKHVYSWAHLIALFDALRHRPMGWTPTGAKASGNSRYYAFRALQFLLSFLPCLAWTALAAGRVVELQDYPFIPLLAGGLFMMWTTGRVVLYHRPNRHRRSLEETTMPAATFAMLRAVTGV